MKEKIVLKNNVEIEIEPGSSLKNIVVMHTGISHMVHSLEQMTDENLSEVIVLNGDGKVSGSYRNLTFVSETSSIVTGGIRTAFNLREKTDVELRIDMLEESQEDQDEAITEMAEMLAETLEE